METRLPFISGKASHIEGGENDAGSGTNCSLEKLFVSAEADSAAGRVSV